MKSRVIQEISENGNIKYIPQHKILWWWINEYEAHGDPDIAFRVEFDILQEAIDYVKNEHKINNTPTFYKKREVMFELND